MSPLAAGSDRTPPTSVSSNSTGLSNPYTADITNYQHAIYWIKSRIDSNSRYRTDDPRFGVDVPAI